MATLTNVQTEYAYHLQDLGALLEQVNVTPTTDVRDRAILAAINDYTRRIPRLKSALVTPISTGFYPVPADWIDVSKIVAIEFPVNMAPVPSYYSPRGGWTFQVREDEVLNFLPNPNPSGQFRLVYTAKHGATAAAPSETLVGSIQVQHEAIIGMIAAARAMREFATRFANTVANNVDSVNYRSKSKEFTDAADALEKRVDMDLIGAELLAMRRADPNTYFKGWK